MAVRGVKSRVGFRGAGCEDSKSKARRWDFRRRRCLRRKRVRLGGGVGIRDEACRRERVVEWRMVCARESKTEDCFLGGGG